MSNRYACTFTIMYSYDLLVFLQIINSIMPTRIKYDEEIETEMKVLKSIANYKKALAKVTKKLHEKGDTMQNELKELATQGTDADVYAVMYNFQLQNIEARRKAEEAEALAQAEAAARAAMVDQQALEAQQSAIYADLFAGDDDAGESGDLFPDDISEGSHDSFRNFGAPMSGALPPPNLMHSRQGSLISRNNTLTAASTPMLSRLGSSRDMLAADAGDLVDGNNLSDDLKSKLNMSGKSRRAKMKAMEDHLKEVADAIAAEQARADLRARTFDEYWLCIGPSGDKKKAKKAKPTPSGKNSPSSKSAPTTPRTAELKKDQSFFDAFLKNPEPVRMRSLMWCYFCIFVTAFRLFAISAGERKFD
jgi:multidrug efflux pump subunit AcrA (membrane-fusion protein)